MVTLRAAGPAGSRRPDLAVADIQHHPRHSHSDPEHQANGAGSARPPCLLADHATDLGTQHLAAAAQAGLDSGACGGSRLDLRGCRSAAARAGLLSGGRCSATRLAGTWRWSTPCATRQPVAPGGARWARQNAADVLARRGHSPKKMELVRRWFSGEFTPHEHVPMAMPIAGTCSCHSVSPWPFYVSFTRS